MNTTMYTMKEMMVGPYEKNRIRVQNPSQFHDPQGMIYPNVRKVNIPAPLHMFSSYNPMVGAPPVYPPNNMQGLWPPPPMNQQPSGSGHRSGPPKTRHKHSERFEGLNSQASQDLMRAESQQTFSQGSQNFGNWNTYDYGIIS